MDLQQSKPAPRRWYALEPFAAAFFAGLALAMMAWPVIQAIAGRAALDRWAMGFTLTVALLAGYWGQRLPRRVLIAAMVILWLVEFGILIRAA